MGKGSRIVVVNGVWYGLHGVIVDVLQDGNLKVWIDNEHPIRQHHFQGTVVLRPFDIELEERKDLWNHLI